MGLIAGMAIVGAGTSMMASMEQTGNANRQARAAYLNQEHQSQLQIQRQNDDQIAKMRQQMMQNLYIGKAATESKVRNKRSLNRVARQQFTAMNQSNKASYDLMNATNSARNISGSSGSAMAMKRQAFNNWARSAESFKYNTKQQFQAIEDQYEGSINRMGSNEYLLDSYVAGQAPIPINGGWSAVAAGVSGATSGAMAGHSLGK